MSGSGNASAVLFKLWVSTAKLQATEGNRLIKALAPNLSSLSPTAHLETLFTQFLHFAKIYSHSQRLPELEQKPWFLDRHYRGPLSVNLLWGKTLVGLQINMDNPVAQL